MPNEIEVAKSAAASPAAIELRLPDVGRVLRNFVSNREVGEFLSGALAGAMTKAVLAPLETIRTRMIVGVGSKHITGSFLEIIEENGWQGLWAGNTINMVRIVPTQAIEFGTFECVKRMVSSAQEKWKDAESSKLHVGHMKMDLFFSWLSPVAVGGAAAGIVSTLVCHPLEVIKDRLTVNREIYPTISLAFRKIYKDDGVGGLYAGMFPTLVGMLPYSTCYYFMYETIKSSYCQSKKKKNLNRAELLVIGAVSEIELDPCEERLLENAKKYIFKHMEVHKKVAQESSRRKAEEHHHCPHYGSRQVAATTAKENNSIQHNHKNGWQRGIGGQHHKGLTASTISFPLEVARKRLMIGKMQGKCPPNMAAALAEVIRVEGFLGLYRGWGASCLKVMPSSGITWMFYEAWKEVLLDKFNQ